MAFDSFQSADHAARLLKERAFRKSRSGQQPNPFGTVVRALWPTKPALNLAQRIGCTERAALYLIVGERRVTAQAVAVIINEIVQLKP